MIIGFVGTAWFVVLLVIAYYILYYNPTLDPFSQDPSQKLERPNPVDMAFYNTASSISRVFTQKFGNRWFSAIRHNMHSSAAREALSEVSLPPLYSGVVRGARLLISVIEQRPS